MMETIRKKYTLGKAGFSFAELMIVMALVAILAAIATPSILRGLPEKRLKSAARNLYADLQKARLLAVKFNRRVVVNFDTANGTYSYCTQFDTTTTPVTCVDLKTVTLASYGGVSYGTGKATKRWDNQDCTQATAIPFLYQGTAGGGTVYLQNNNNDICYAVAVSNYGNVTIGKFDGTGWDKK